MLVRPSFELGQNVRRQHDVVGVGPMRSAWNEARHLDEVALGDHHSSHAASVFMASRYFGVIAICAANAS